MQLVQENAGIIVIPQDFDVNALFGPAPEASTHRPKRESARKQRKKARDSFEVPRENPSVVASGFEPKKSTVKAFNKQERNRQGKPRGHVRVQRAVAGYS